MNCIIIRVYSFGCDHPGCDEVEEIDGVYDKPEAEEHLLKLHPRWTVRSRKHYCSEHSK